MRRYGPAPSVPHKEVAAVALAASGVMSVAVAAAFGVSAESARKMICRARNAGHPIPLVTTEVKYPLDVVARVACAASGSKGEAVEQHFGVSRTHANRLIEMARKAGHNIPRVRSAPTTRLHPMVKTGLVLECGCGAPFGLDALALAAHTRRVHGRYPTITERTPRLPFEVAA